MNYNENRTHSHYAHSHTLSYCATIAYYLMQKDEETIMIYLTSFIHRSPLYEKSMELKGRVLKGKW